MRTVALYLRVSTQDQNLDLQRLELTEYVSAKKWKLYKIYSETGSGTKANRPELQKLLTDAREKQFDVIMTWRLDRLFRSLRHLVMTLNELQEIGVDFISLKDGIEGTTPSGKLLLHLTASFAEFEAAIIKERVISGLRAAKNRGVQLGAPKKINHDKVIDLVRSGHSTSAISARLGISQPSVSRIKLMMKQKGSGEIES